MEVIKICAAAMCAVFASSILKPVRKEFAIAVSLICGVVVFGIVFVYVRYISDTVKNIFERFGVDNELVAVIFKIIGISYICEFTSGLCRDAGENAIALRVETGGKLIIVYLALPIVMSFLDMVEKFLR